MVTKILLKSELGFTLDNIPNSIFRFVVGGVNTYPNGDIIVSVNNIDYDIFKRAIENRIGTSIRGTVSAADSVIFSRLESRQPNIQPANVNQAQTDEVDDEDEEEKCEICGHFIDACVCQYCETCEELIDNCTCSKSNFRDVEKEGSTNENLQRLTTIEKVENDKISLILASKMSNNSSAKAKLLMDKIYQYNQCMGSIITLQNEINRLSADVNKDPIITKLLPVIDKLKSADNMIEDIFFNKDYLVIQTKDIITNPLSDGKRRKIGKMEFYINLECMLGITPNRFPIIIRNRTREDDNVQQCGHVNYLGQSCFGSWLESILKAFNSYDIEQLIDILIRFVKTPNEEDSMGEPIRNWPIVEDNQ
jgi:hypothetical protein